jgi:hypothetical protein
MTPTYVIILSWSLQLHHREFSARFIYTVINTVQACVVLTDIPFVDPNASAHNFRGYIMFLQPVPLMGCHSVDGQGSERGKRILFSFRQLNGDIYYSLHPKLLVVLIF